MKRATNLALAAVVATSAIVNGFRFWLFEITNPHGDDFRFYYSMALVGLRYGWSRIYDQALQCMPIGPIPEPTPHCPALALPPVAWSVAPLTLLPYASAYPIWVVLLFLCFAAVVALLWKSLPEPKGIFAAAAFTLFPLAYCLYLGQVTIIAALGVVLAWWLLRSGRPGLAGVALVLILAKPQAVLLVPVVLAVAGHRRTTIVFLALSIGIGLASLAVLGAHGVTEYLSISRVQLGSEENYVYTLTGMFGPWLGTALQCAFALVAIATAWRLRDRLDAVVVAGILGSALLSPYWHVPDFVVLIPAAAFQLSLGPRPWNLLPAAGLFIAGSPLVTGVTYITAAVQVGAWLVLEVAWLLWLATRPRVAFPEPAAAPA